MIKTLANQLISMKKIPLEPPTLVINPWPKFEYCGTPPLVIDPFSTRWGVSHGYGLIVKNGVLEDLMARPQIGTHIFYFLWVRSGGGYHLFR